MKREEAEQRAKRCRRAWDAGDGSLDSFIADALQEAWAEGEAAGVKISLPGDYPRWIPVEERLPEKFVNVLVWPRTGPDVTFWTGEGFHRHAPVTHWMPLPEGP